MTLPTYRPRATRYALDCRVAFRADGESEWRDGWLKNISESGLLFDPGTRLEPGSVMELVIAMPPPAGGSLWCRAEIARIGAATPEVGARVTDYRLERRAP
jgi:hypothetical protein